MDSHVGILRGEGGDGDLIEEQLPLVRADGRVQLVDGLAPVVLLTHLLQHLEPGPGQGRRVRGRPRGARWIRVHGGNCT